MNSSLITSFSVDVYTEKFIYTPNSLHFKYNDMQVELHSKQNS